MSKATGQPLWHFSRKIELSPWKEKRSLHDYRKVDAPFEIQILQSFIVQRLFTHSLQKLLDQRGLYLEVFGSERVLCRTKKVLLAEVFGSERVVFGGFWIREGSLQSFLEQERFSMLRLLDQRGLFLQFVELEIEVLYLVRSERILCVVFVGKKWFSVQRLLEQRRFTVQHCRIREDYPLELFGSERVVSRICWIRKDSLQRLLEQRRFSVLRLLVQRRLWLIGATRLIES